MLSRERETTAAPGRVQVAHHPQSKEIGEGTMRVEAPVPPTEPRVAEEGVVLVSGDKTEPTPHSPTVVSLAQGTRLESRSDTGTTPLSKGISESAPHAGALGAPTGPQDTPLETHAPMLGNVALGPRTNTVTTLQTVAVREDQPRSTNDTRAPQVGPQPVYAALREGISWDDVSPTTGEGALMQVDGGRTPAASRGAPPVEDATTVEIKEGVEVRTDLQPSKIPPKSEEAMLSVNGGMLGHTSQAPTMESTAGEMLVESGASPEAGKLQLPPAVEVNRSEAATGMKTLHMGTPTIHFALREGTTWDDVSPTTGEGALMQTDGDGRTLATSRGAPPVVNVTTVGITEGVEVGTDLQPSKVPPKSEEAKLVVKGGMVEHTPRAPTMESTAGETLAESGAPPPLAGELQLLPAAEINRSVTAIDVKTHRMETLPIHIALREGTLGDEVSLAAEEDAGLQLDEEENKPAVCQIMSPEGGVATGRSTGRSTEEIGRRTDLHLKESKIPVTSPGNGCRRTPDTEACFRSLLNPLRMEMLTQLAPPPPSDRNKPTPLRMADYSTLAERLDSADQAGVERGAAPHGCMDVSTCPLDLGRDVEMEDSCQDVPSEKLEGAALDVEMMDPCQDWSDMGVLGPAQNTAEEMGRRQSEKETLVAPSHFERTTPMAKPCLEGLENRGDTCYMNVVSQCLIKGVDLGLGRIRELPHVCDRLCTICILAGIAEGSGRAVSQMVPLGRVMAGLTRRGDGRGQQDAHELLLHLVDDIQRRAGVASPFSRMFACGMVVTTSCARCLNEKSMPQEERGLFVHRAAEIQEALSNLWLSVRVTDYVCDSCGERGHSTRRTELVAAPEILILCVAGRPGALPRIPLSEKVLLEPRDGATWYELGAVVVHQGISGVGHYVSFTCDEEGRWLHQNDRVERTASWREVQASTPHFMLLRRLKGRKAPRRSNSGGDLEPNETALTMPAPGSKVRESAGRFKFYAIANGRNGSGVVTSWGEAEPLVTGLRCAVFKGFNTMVEADAFIRGTDPGHRQATLSGLAQSMEWYVVSRGRRPGCYATWSEASLQVHSFPGGVAKRVEHSQSQRLRGPCSVAYLFFAGMNRAYLLESGGGAMLKQWSFNRLEGAGDPAMLVLMRAVRDILSSCGVLGKLGDVQAYGPLGGWEEGEWTQVRGMVQKASGAGISLKIADLPREVRHSAYEWCYGVPEGIPERKPMVSFPMVEMIPRPALGDRRGRVAEAVRTRPLAITQGPTKRRLGGRSPSDLKKTKSSDPRRDSMDGPAGAPSLHIASDGPPLAEAKETRQQGSDNAQQQNRLQEDPKPGSGRVTPDCQHRTGPEQAETPTGADSQPGRDKPPTESNAEETASAGGIEQQESESTQQEIKVHEDSKQETVTRLADGEAIPVLPDYELLQAEFEKGTATAEARAERGRQEEEVNVVKKPAEGTEPQESESAQQENNLLEDSKLATKTGGDDATPVLLEEGSSPRTVLDEQTAKDNAGDGMRLQRAVSSETSDSEMTCMDTDVTNSGDDDTSTCSAPSEDPPELGKCLCGDRWLPRNFWRRPLASNGWCNRCRRKRLKGTLMVNCSKCDFDQCCDLAALKAKLAKEAKKTKTKRRRAHDKARKGPAGADRDLLYLSSTDASSSGSKTLGNFARELVSRRSNRGRLRKQVFGNKRRVGTGSLTRSCSGNEEDDD